MSYYKVIFRKDKNDRFTDAGVYKNKKQAKRDKKQLKRKGLQARVKKISKKAAKRLIGNNNPLSFLKREKGLNI